MGERTRIDVPYVEKDEAKALGARWDPAAKTWYVPAGKDPKPFSKWLPSEKKTEHDFLMMQPAYIVTSFESCWKCSQIVPVATLATTSYEYLEADYEDDEYADFYLIGSINWLTDTTLAALRRFNPGYRRRYSNQASMTYFMNHCTCGAPFGDHFMYSEPGGSFFPMDERQARTITLRLLSSKPVKVAGSPMSSSPDLVWRYAKRA